MIVSCRKVKILQIVAAMTFLSKSKATNQVLCENIVFDDWGLEMQKVCLVSEAKLHSVDFEFASQKDSSMHVLCFDLNKEVYYLPVDVYKTFPNIEVYSASECSLRSISKENFQKLMSCTYLWLKHNELFKIDSNTFEDLVSLEKLYLGMTPYD